MHAKTTCIIVLCAWIQAIYCVLYDNRHILCKHYYSGIIVSVLQYVELNSDGVRSLYNTQKKKYRKKKFYAFRKVISGASVSFNLPPPQKKKKKKKKKKSQKTK